MRLKFNPMGLKAVSLSKQILLLGLGLGLVSTIFGGALSLWPQAQAELKTAQQPIPKMSDQDLKTLDSLSMQRRAEERKSDQIRLNAREIALEVEALRQKIIDISRKQDLSEQRNAVYQARLAALKQKEIDLARRLSASRAKHARLLAALQIYRRNAPPALLVSAKRTNEAVTTAILLKSISPYFREKTEALRAQNEALVKLRRDVAIS